MSLPTFHTPLFRKISARLDQDIQRVKDEAVMFAVEPTHAHAERVGYIAGLIAAANIMSEADKELAGVQK